MIRSIRILRNFFRIITNTNDMKKTINYMLITISSFVYGVAVSLFLEPNHVISGGFTGLAMIFTQLFKVPTGTLLFLMNIPILLIGWYKFGLRFILSTAYATIMVSVFTDLLSDVKPLTHSMFLGAIMGNVLIAISLAVIFYANATTGGMDIVVRLLRIRYPHIKSGNLFLYADILIIGIYIVLFRNIDAAIYALIGVTVMSMVFDRVLYGHDEAKMLFIISSQAEEITSHILDEMKIGATLLIGKGAYTGCNQKIILCVVRKNRFAKIEEIIKKVDCNVFMIVANSTEIFGEGYKDLFAEKL